MVLQRHARIIPGRLMPDSRSRPDPRWVMEWNALADAESSIAGLNRKLFLKLRKCSDGDDLTDSLLALQHLAFTGSASGAALLAAYLDVTTAGARLLPFIHSFTNTRRLSLLLQAKDKGLDQTARSWLNRLDSAMVKAKAHLKRAGTEPAMATAGLMGVLRPTLESLLSVSMNCGELSGEEREFLVELLTLETDAWQERVSRLAGLVNPYRASSVTRVLPILSLADAAIRDLRQLIGWVEAGQDNQAFSRNGFRALEVLENEEFQRIYKRLCDDSRLKALHEIHQGGRDNPLKTALLGHAVARLWALESRVQEQGFQPGTLSLVSAVAAVQQFTRRNTVAIPLDMEQEAFLDQVLKAEEGVKDADQGQDTGPAAWCLDGVELSQGQLIIRLDHDGKAPPSWPRASWRRSTGSTRPR